MSKQVELPEVAELRNSMRENAASHLAGVQHYLHLAELFSQESRPQLVRVMGMTDSDETLAAILLRNIRAIEVNLEALKRLRSEVVRAVGWMDRGAE